LCSRQNSISIWGKMIQQRLKSYFTSKQKHYIYDPSRTPSAVLLPLYYEKDQLRIIFIKRTENVRTHKGQIAFPGGTYEEKDQTLANTVLRECTEEIGLPSREVELLGEMDDVLSRTSHYVITPFIGMISKPCELQADGTETEDIFSVPISSLYGKEITGTEIMNDREVITYTYNYKKRLIWGATARILYRFLNTYAQVNENNSTRGCQGERFPS